MPLRIALGLALLLSVAAPAGLSGPVMAAEAAPMRVAEAEADAERWVKVQVYNQGAAEPEVTVSVPASALKAASRLLPDSVQQNLKAEGVDVAKIVAAAEAEDLHGVIAVVEKDARRIVISLE